MWAERYDRGVLDIFDVQDEVTRAIVGAVAPEFLATEAKRARRKDPAQLDAWECVMRGRAHLWKQGREDAAEARTLFERAIELLPNGAVPERSKSHGGISRVGPGDFPSTLKLSPAN